MLAITQFTTTIRSGGHLFQNIMHSFEVPIDKQLNQTIISTSLNNNNTFQAIRVRRRRSHVGGITCHSRPSNT